MKIVFRAFFALCSTLVAYYCVKTWLTECNTFGAFLLATIPSLFVVLADYVIFYSLLPRLQVKNPYIKVKTKNNLVEYSIKIPVQNPGRYSALQVEIEACVLERNQDNLTYHLQADFSRFLMIPGAMIALDNIRVFDFTQIAPPTLQYIDNVEKAIGVLRQDNSVLRVRLYGTHAISGLGRGYEYQFKLTGDIFVLESGPKYDVLSLFKKPSFNFFA